MNGMLQMLRGLCCHVFKILKSKDNYRHVFKILKSKDNYQYVQGNVLRNKNKNNMWTPCA